MTHDDVDPKMRFYSVFPKEKPGFVIGVKRGSVSMQVTAIEDDYQDDLDTILEFLEQVIAKAVAERDILRTLSEMDKDLDDLLGDGE